MMRKTLLGQIYPAYLAIILLSIVVLSIFAFSFFRDLLKDQYTEQLESSAQIIVNTFDARMLDNPELVDSFCKNTLRGTEKHLTIIYPDGTVIGDSQFNPRELGDYSERPEFKEAINGKSKTVIRKNLKSDGRWIFHAAPVFYSDNVAAVLILSSDFGRIEKGLREALISIFLSALVITGITAIFSFFVVRRINKPISIMQSAAAEFSRGMLDRRIKINHPEEIKSLADTLNTMAEELRLRIETVSSQKNELEAILSSMVEAVIVLDSGLRIRSMNKAAYRLLQKEEGGGIGKTVIEYMRNSDLNEFAQRILRRNEVIEDNITFYAFDILHLQVHGTVIKREDNEEKSILLVMSDITRLKHLEDLRRDFVANVSHELKTPITSVKGFVETLKDGALDDKETATHFLSIIEHHADRLHLIIEDLLSLSRLEQFERSIQFEEYSIEGIINAVKEICEPKAAGKKISIIDNYSGNTTVTVNASLIEQALVNLVDNAIKYSNMGSSIEINISNKSGILTIQVSDQGQGIPQKDLPRIFERFYRVDRARSREMGGTGLGLAIVKHITLAHRGEVRVESVLEEGSTFSIEIPQPPISFTV